MLVEQIWVDNPLRNFNYLIACPETGEALAIDPLHYRRCLGAARERGWEITQVLNTHEHHDHIGGNRGIVEATGARLLAHQGASRAIPEMDVGLRAGDIVKVGTRVTLRVMDTPGHTMTHVCLLAEAETPALFCGDTLFNAGAGNCHNGGHPEQLFKTFSEQLATLPGATLVYPGHDYLSNNLRFTLDREPDNQAAKRLLEQVGARDAALVTSLRQEKEINTFFRLGEPQVIEKLVELFPDLGDDPSPRRVFLRLRELRNRW